MARKVERLTVSNSATALDALDEIWGWNAEQYRSKHARRYIDFRKTETDKLASTHVEELFLDGPTFASSRSVECLKRMAISPSTKSSAM